MTYKFKWLLSGFILSFFLKKFGFPSFFAFPTFSKGLRNVSIGRRVRIFPGLRIETHNQGVIVINDNVGIAQNVHITSSGNLSIGEGTTILANSFITNIDHGYQDIRLSPVKQPIIVNETYIGRNCFIGMGVAIQAGTILGDHCIVGANSVVRGVFPAYSVIAGIPAKVIKKYDAKRDEWLRVNN